MWTPDQLDSGANLPLNDETLNIMGAYTPPSASYSPASATPGTSYSEHKPKTPPPDLPSLLLDSRIVYIGMPVSVLSITIYLSFSLEENLTGGWGRAPQKKKKKNVKPWNLGGEKKNTLFSN